jgi:hypothetical protein
VIPTPRRKNGGGQAARPALFGCSYPAFPAEKESNAMKPFLVICGFVPVVGLIGYFFYDRTANADPYNEFTTWPPTSAAIRQELKTEVPNNDEKARRQLFAKLFQSRFRNHQPMMAIGMKFMENGHIKLMCPARMEPWDMDNIAMSLWHETHDVFGTNYEVDIYETFIGMPPLKVGELRAVPMRPDIVHISYQYPNKVIYSPYGRRPATAARPNNSVSPAQTARPVL